MSPPTLLVVDDHPQVLRHRKNTLEALGYSVLTAPTGASALMVLEKTAIAAVLIEYKFEGIDAEAVANQLKARFPSTPVVLLSAYCGIPERVLWLVDEYIMRSDPVDKLVGAIERVTASHAYERRTAVPSKLSRLFDRSIA